MANTTLTVVHAAVVVACVGITTAYRLSPAAEAGESNLPRPTAAEDKESIVLPSPEGDVTLASWIVFAWVSAIIRQGQKAKLGYSDVWMLPSNMASEGVRLSAKMLK